MPSFSFTKIFIFFSVIWFLSVQNVDAQKPYELVDKVCSKQGDVNWCFQVLKSDPRSKFAKDIKTLTKIAVDVAINNFTKTRDYFQSVKSGPPAVLKSLKVCIYSYNVVIREFEASVTAPDCASSGYDIHIGGDEIKRCQTITDENGAHDSFITSNNQVTLRFCGFTESLANLICEE